MTTVAFQGQGGGLPKEEWTLASVKGGEKYVARVPQVLDLWQDPQERYDLFMNNFTERTWTLVTISEAIKGLMKTYATHPPRKLQSESYSGPITLSHYDKFQWMRDSSIKRASPCRCRPGTSV